jgi:nucleotide-binding universal stress UspA family protein
MTWSPKQSIVVPVDFSDASFDAIRVALEIVNIPSQVHVLYVIQPLHVAEPGMLWGTITDDERLNTATKALDERIASEDVRGVTSKVLLGQPGQTIAEYAAQVRADLIVIPSHGRSGASRVFLGSVTEKVLRMARCQVLVLRVPDSDEG